MVTFIKVMWWVYVVSNIILIPLNLFINGYEKNLKEAVTDTIKNGLALIFFFAIRGYLPF